MASEKKCSSKGKCGSFRWEYIGLGIFLLLGLVGSLLYFDNPFSNSSS